MFFGLSDSTPYTGPTYNTFSPTGFNVPGDPNNPAGVYYGVEMPGQEGGGSSARGHSIGGGLGAPEVKDNSWVVWAFIGLAVFAVFFGSRR